MTELESSIPSEPSHLHEARKTVRKVPRTFSALQYRNYQLWFGGMLISVAGTWMQSIAQGWLVYQISHSEFTLGLMGFASAIPILVITPFGGIVADFFPKRTLLVITQTTMMILALILSVLTFTGAVQVWHIIVLAGLLGVANAFDAPARQAFVVEMVDREDLTNAIAMNSMMFNGARIVGPALGGLLLAAVGAGWCFLFNGISFLAVIAGLLLMRVSRPAHRPEMSHPLQQIADGFRYAMRQKEIFALLLLAGVFGIFGSSYGALMPAYVDKIFHSGATSFGYINTAIGIGAISASFILARFTSRSSRGQWLFFANIGYCLTLILFAINSYFPIALVLSFGLGMGFMLQLNNINSLLQTRVDDRMRGRVMSLYMLTLFGFSPFGNLLAGSLAEKWSLTGTVGIFGVTMLLVSMAVFIKIPEIRRMI
jgi:MFS family permease